MPITMKVVEVDPSGNSKRIRVRFTPTGAYPASGEPVDLTKVTNPSNFPGGFFGGLPITWSMASDPDGYSAELIAAAAPTLPVFGNLWFWTSGGTQLNGNYPAAVLTDFLDIDFFGPKGQM